MRLRSLFGGGLLLRAIARELTGIRLALTRQADALDRLADRVAPRVDRPPAAEIADTGASVFDPLEGALVLDYVRRTEAATGRAPTEEEILTYLADESTVELHARLAEREQELLARGRG